MAGRDALRIGVDVGGTNTDVVALKGSIVVGKAKVATTEDITSGVASCIELVINKLANVRLESVQKTKSLISRVNIGTTHFINAVIQRKNLDKVSVIRLCGPSSRALPPFIDFPDDLKSVIYGSCHLVNGGFHFDGRTISHLDESEIISTVNEIKGIGIKSIVVSGIFAASNPEQENRVKSIIRQHYADASISLSHEIGHNGILERENAAILNESLKSLSKNIVTGFQQELQDIGIKCPIYLTQNDGTLIKAEDVVQFPVYTFSSGATNSLRGASFLSGLKDAIVVDIGGTSTDVGVLHKGFPKESSARVKVGGVNTNFRMPDVLCIGLGGGSIVSKLRDEKGSQVDISKQSVERRLEKEALVFGGNTLTTTDVAVAAGIARIGDPQNVSSLDQNFCEDVLKLIKSKVESVIDQVKLNSESCPVIIVGGGSILLKDGTQLDGVSQLIKPRHFEVANAVGAALSQISGTFDRFVDVTQVTNEQAIDLAMKSAIEIAIKNGAIPETVEIIDVVDTHITYVAIPTRRIKVKAVGDLEKHDLIEGNTEIFEEAQKDEKRPVLAEDEIKVFSDAQLPNKDRNWCSEPRNVPPERDVPSPSQPIIDEKSGEWILGARDIECICIGAGVMGCGGGGSPYIGRLRLMKLLEQGKKMRVIDPASFKDKKGLILIIAFMGAPAILIEKLIGGEEMATAAKAVLKMHALGLGSKDVVISNETRKKLQIKQDENVEVVGDVAALFQAESDSVDKPSILALMSAEIGGMNSVEPLIAASQSGLPVLDCDCMGRAFPKLEHMIPCINGCSPTPAAICDEKGEVVAVVSVNSARELEDYFRKQTIRMGCVAGVAVALSVDDVLNKCPQYTLSRAWRIGDAVLSARSRHADPVQALVESENAAVLIAGKIVEVHRQTKNGFDYGYVIIEGLGFSSEKKLKIEFQNENLIVVDMSSDVVLATVPDLISIVDSDRGEPITTEENRYGLRVSVILLPAMPSMCTAETLNVFGPQSFGYDGVLYQPFSCYKDFQPISKLT